jgi:hypothetical protein
MRRTLAPLALALALLPAGGRAASTEVSAQGRFTSTPGLAVSPAGACRME